MRFYAMRYSSAAMAPFTVLASRAYMRVGVRSLRCRLAAPILGPTKLALTGSLRPGTLVVDPDLRLRST